MHNKKLGIWFTQGYANLYHAMQDIRRADDAARYHLVCSHPHPEFVGFAGADATLHEPSSSLDYLQFVQRCVEQHNVKVIIPSRNQAWFNSHRHLLPETKVLTVASNATLSLLDNKVKLYNHLADKNITAIPAFRTFKSLAEFDAAFASLRTSQHKLCIKPARGVYGSGFRILKSGSNTMTDLLSESMTLSTQSLRHRLAADGSHSMLLMEYLAGDERSVDCLANNGHLIAAVVRRKSSSSVAAQVIEHRPDLLNQVTQLTQLLGLNGLFNVQFKDQGGVPYLLEINTRLSGRSYYATLAGVNLPYLAAELFGRSTTPADLKFSVNVGMRIGNVNSPIQVVADAGPVREEYGFFESC